MKIARAIDVGYGNTKFTTSDGTTGPDIQCRMFPSVAPISAKRVVDTFLTKKETVFVEGDDCAFYEVGPDAMLAMPSNGSRSLDVEFFKKGSYMALMRCAMHYMDVPYIDHLVVGLPVASMETAVEQVRAKLIGEHRLPNRTIEVRDAIVVPQPVGGMYDYGVRNQVLRHLNNCNNLLIDPGYFTLDWVVTHGTKMIGGRSGSANNGGMAGILRNILEKVCSNVSKRDNRVPDITESVLNRLDLAIRTGDQFVINGHPEPIGEYLEGINPIVRNALEKLSERIGSISDIDNIIIVGGSAHMYEKAVCEMFKGFDVRVAKDAIFSNVRGFQLMGNVALKRSQSSELANA